MKTKCPACGARASVKNGVLYHALSPMCSTFVAAVSLLKRGTSVTLMRELARNPAFARRARREWLAHEKRLHGSR